MKREIEETIDALVKKTILKEKERKILQETIKMMFQIKDNARAIASAIKMTEQRKSSLDETISTLRDSMVSLSCLSTGENTTVNLKLINKEIVYAIENEEKDITEEIVTLSNYFTD